jgi:hypothetical protein
VYKYQKCPYCEHEVTTTNEVGCINISGNALPERLKRQLKIKLWGCTGCGWWSENIEYFDPTRGGEPFEYEEGTLAVLRQFKAQDPTLPLSALTLELRKHPKILYDLNSQKFEQLVAAVFSDFSKVEAKIVGRSGDRGVDVILLDGDSRVAIQVKRRMDADTSEGVSIVREFLGAMVSEGFRCGKLVTTASRFTHAAVATRDRAIARRAVDEFDLVDGRKFYDMFKSTNQRFPWSRRVDEIQKHWRDRGVQFNPI